MYILNKTKHTTEKFKINNDYTTTNYTYPIIFILFYFILINDGSYFQTNILFDHLLNSKLEPKYNYNTYSFDPKFMFTLMFSIDNVKYLHKTRRLLNKFISATDFNTINKRTVNECHPLY